MTLMNHQGILYMAAKKSYLSNSNYVDLIPNMIISHAHAKAHFEAFALSFQMYILCKCIKYNMNIHANWEGYKTLNLQYNWHWTRCAHFRNRATFVDSYLITYSLKTL